MEIHWSVAVWAWPILGAAGLGAVLWSLRMYRAAEPPLPPRMRRGLVLLRSAALVLLLLALAGPSLFVIRTEHRPAEVVVVLDDTASMALADGGEGEPRRWDRALGLAAAADSILRSRDGEVRTVLLRGNGLEVPDPLPPDLHGALPPVSVGGDLVALTRQVGLRFAEKPLCAMVLIGDGHDTADRRRGSAGVSMGAATLVVVGVGDPDGPPDRVLQDLRYPDVAYQADEVVVEVAVSSRFPSGAADRRLTVRLLEGGDVVAEAADEADAEGGVTRFELGFVPGRDGLRVYEVEVEALDNERYLDNNRATLAIDVRKERGRLLLLTGRPGWDVRFLVQAAAREPRLSMDVAYRAESGLVLAEESGPWQLPADEAGWRLYDGVVLTGWEDLRRDVDWENMAAAVRSGLGLLVLPGGAESRPRSANGPVLRTPPEPLVAMLPLRMSTWRWQTGEWAVQPGLGGTHHTLLAGVVQQHLPGGGSELTRLPPLVGVVPGELRAGAASLLEAVDRRGGEEAASVPLLVIGRVQAGRVAWFGGRRLWQLAFYELPLGTADSEEQPARRLLRNLLVWTASGGDDTGLSLVGHRTVYDEGERIRLETQWRDLQGDPVVESPLSLHLDPLDPGSEMSARDFSLQPVPGREGHAAVTLPPLPPGRYRIQPRTADERQLAGRESHLVVSPHSLEGAQVRQDRRRLRQLADAAGGVYVDGEGTGAVEKLAEALARISLAGDERTTRSRWDLWAGWPLLLIASALLGLEWYIRRRQGLL